MPPRLHVFQIYSPTTPSDNALRLLEESWSYYCPTQDQLPPPKRGRVGG
ncbi:MAG: hypothetical protein AAF366_05070 [Pseudomonadota bacterium]